MTVDRPPSIGAFAARDLTGLDASETRQDGTRRAEAEPRLERGKRRAAAGSGYGEMETLQEGRAGCGWTATPASSMFCGATLTLRPRLLEALVLALALPLAVAAVLVLALALALPLTLALALPVAPVLVDPPQLTVTPSGDATSIRPTAATTALKTSRLGIRGFIGSPESLAVRGH